MFLIDMVKVIGVPAGNEVPLSGLTVTSMSESEHAAPLAELEGLAELEALAVAVGVGDGDGLALGPVHPRPAPRLARALPPPDRPPPALRSRCSWSRRI